MDYQYKVVYKDKSNAMHEKLYHNIKDICRDFNVNRNLVKNIYMKVPKTQHNFIISIDRLPIPIKKETNIVIKFN